MKKLILSLCCVVALLPCSHPLTAQSYVYDTGVPTFSTQIPIENGFINVNNGEIHIEIPLATHPQRGHLQLAERLVYDSRIWKIVANGGYSWQPTNVPNAMGGWRFVRGTETGGVTSYGQDSQAFECGMQTTYDAFAWTDPSGTQHYFPVSTVLYTNPSHQRSCQDQLPPNQPTGYGFAVDGSGYSVNITNFTTMTVVDPSGNEVYPSVSDSNGNYFSVDSNGNLVDTLNRTPLTVTQNGNTITYSVLGWNGQISNYVVTLETVNYSTAFNQLSVADSAGSFTAIQSIQLPDLSTYSFGYDSGTLAGHYGELTSVTLPATGTIQYGWANFLDSFNNENRWLQTRVKDGGTTTFRPATTSTCSGTNGCQETVTVTSPDGNDTVYTFALDSTQASTAGKSWNTSVVAWQGSSTSGGTALRSIATAYSYYSGTIRGTIYNRPTSYTTTTNLLDAGLSSQTVTTLDQTGSHPSVVGVWDYYPTTSGPPTAASETTSYTYLATCGFLPTQITVTDGSNNQVSSTTYSYDQSTPSPTSGLSHHNTGSNCGNLTTASQWINSPSGSLTTTATYDDAGQILSSTDQNGTTTYGHDSTDAFVTSVTPPTPSSGVSLPSTTTYDVGNSGLLASSTDANLQTTWYKNYDWAGRVGEIDYPDGGKTTLSYSPTQSSVYQYQNGSAHTDAETQFDAYGRKSRTAMANGQSGTSWYQEDTCYDTNGRVDFTSYRYQGSGWTTQKVCSGPGDTWQFDGLSRLTQVAHGDGSGTSIQYSYMGRATRVTDENGVSRITQNDGLGRPSGVCEISSNNAMPGSGSPSSCGLDLAGSGFTTAYTYDLANHKQTVSEGSQARVFQTDSLGRTVLTQEPESGDTTYSYTYNSTGLLVTRVRPQQNQANSNVTTTTYSQYDSLGRLVETWYTDSTPTKYYYYDAPQEWGISLQNPKGRLVWQLNMVGPSGTGTVYSYDSMGRVAGSWSCTPSSCGHSAYSAAFTYDWLGNVLTAGDGAGYSQSYAYSVANEVLSITNSYSDVTHPSNLVSNASYGPFGPLSWQLGNGLSGNRQYDTGGRIESEFICSGSSSPGCSGGTAAYDYSVTWKGSYATGRCDSVRNQCDNLGYDEFGRLASDTVTLGVANNYTWTYDRWGNRWNQTPLNIGLTENLQFNSANKITSAGFLYDAAGNMISDPNHGYVYDAEGNLIQVLTGGTPIATFSYDALNRRIRIDQPGTDSEEFVFNPAGQHTSSWNVTNGGLWNSWAYWGSSPVEFWGMGVENFQHQDWLGTIAARTTYNGQMEGTFSSLPFGDGLTTVSGSDWEPLHFAGLDHDYSSDTDHAQFRQYTSAAGNWMSPDPYSGSYDFSNPQSFNRYSYVLSNPLSMTDPQGLDGGGGCWYCQIENFFAALFGLSDIQPSFRGSLKPRPNSQPWDEHNIIYGANIAGALGLPDAGCEFGACGPGAMGFGQGQNAMPANLPPGTPQIYWAPFLQGFNAAKKALKKKGCSAFYGGLGPQTMDAATYRFLNLGDPTVGAETVSPDSVFINSGGAYMTYTPAPGQAGPFGRFWTQSQFRAFILLHELGHQLSGTTGFGPDAGSPLNQVQSGWVLSHCF